MRNAPIRVQPATPMTAAQLAESWTPANPPGRPPPGDLDNPYIVAADPTMGTMPRIGARGGPAVGGEARGQAAAMRGGGPGATPSVPTDIATIAAIVALIARAP